MVNIKMNINDGWFDGGLNCIGASFHKVAFENNVIIKTCHRKVLCLS